MAAIQISCVGYAVLEFINGYEMLGGSRFSKDVTFTLKVKISWNAGNVGCLRLYTII